MDDQTFKAINAGPQYEFDPTELLELLDDADPQRAQRVMLATRRIDIGALRAAADGASGGPDGLASAGSCPG